MTSPVKQGIAPRVISVRRKDKSGVVVVHMPKQPEPQPVADSQATEAVTRSQDSSSPVRARYSKKVDGEEDMGQSEKENQQHTLQILSLCEVCKEIFSNMTDLRVRIIILLMIMGYLILFFDYFNTICFGGKHKNFTKG